MVKKKPPPLGGDVGLRRTLYFWCMIPAWTMTPNWPMIRQAHDFAYFRSIARNEFRKNVPALGQSRYKATVFLKRNNITCPLYLQ